MSSPAAPAHGSDVGPGPASVEGDAGTPPALAAHLRRWRAGSGLSVADAARRFGVATTTARNWELGRRPQPLQLERIARHFGWDAATARAMAGDDRVRTVRTSGGDDASRLCRARMAVGLTMTQVANRVGVVPATISRWENGLRRPSPEHLESLARVLRVTVFTLEELLAEAPHGRWDGVELPSLGELRRRSGLSQRAFAAAVGIGTTTANKWEHGRVRVPEGRLPAIARVLHTDVQQLVREAGLPRAPAAPPRSPLAALRAGAGMTQREVAHHVRMSTGSLHRFETGARSVPLPVVRSLARCYRRDLADVLQASGLAVPAILAQRSWVREDLPGLLSALRWASGCSAAELARRIDVSPRLVREWERGAAEPGRATCQRLELLHRLPPGRLTSLIRGPGGSAA